MSISPYPAAVVLSAHDVAAALRARHPHLPTVKLHKLLYYCQGHHLATFGRPLFQESLSAWDLGPVVGALWRAEKNGETVEHRELDEASLNTVGYVLSRYGGLTGEDLVRLTHSEEPWRLADVDRRPGTSTTIRNEWIEEFFRSSASAAEEDEIVLDAAVVARWLDGAERSRDVPATPDSAAAFANRIEELRSRVRRSA
jgi:uncharacterized phage-associated protein